MHEAVYYNLFTVWAVAFMGLVVGLYILRASRRQAGERAFALFWLLFAGVWLFAGVRQLCYICGSVEWDRAFFIVVQLFVAGHLVPAVYFLARRTLRRDSLTLAATLFATVGSLLYLLFVALDGVQYKPPTEFGSEWSLSPRTFVAFGCVFCLAVILTCADLVLWARRRLRRAENCRVEYALVALSLLIYEAVGVADAKGLTAGWGMLAGRGMMLVSAILSYFCYSWTSTQLVVLGSTDKRPAENDRGHV